VVHAIYHQLELITGEKEGALQQLQFITRSITADKKPLWVIDLIGSCDFSSLTLNSHFTGSAAGDITTIVMNGIPMQVIGGYGTSAAFHQDFTQPLLVWANLPTMPIIPQWYLADIVTKMGCDPEGIVFILYAKADIIRTNAKVRQDRHSLNHKANSQACPTIIFKCPSSLKYFLDHFDHFASFARSNNWRHSPGNLSREQTIALYADTPKTPSVFLHENTAKCYLSDGKRGYHHSLNSKLETPTQNQDSFVAVTNLLLEVQKSWRSQPLQSTSERLLHRYWEPLT
jgi:hypothetical protein